MGGTLRTGQGLAIKLSWVPDPFSISGLPWLNLPCLRFKALLLQSSSSEDAGGFSALALPGGQRR